MSLDETTTAFVPSPGARLRAAREAASMSQDDIATKLKLSVRQVAAIESGDWSALPERTFTRGFMRSYARLVGLDPESVGIEQGTTQSIAATELKPTPEAIGEIAHESDRHGNRLARWAVPAALIAVITAGAAYFQWGHLAGLPGKPGSLSVARPPAASSSPPVEATTARAGEAAAPAAVTTPSGPTTDGASKDAPPSPPAAESVAAPAASTAAPTLAPLPAITASPALLPRPGEKRITLTFKGKSWTEVRSKGEVIFSETAQPGSREFNGAVPLSFTVGNASNVTVSVDGKPFDMSELTRNDVARFRIE